MSRAQTMTLVAAFLGWMFDGLEMGIFPLVARPALQEIPHAAGILDEAFVQLWMGRITATLLLGAAAGSRRGAATFMFRPRYWRVSRLQLVVPGLPRLQREVSRRRGSGPHGHCGVPRLAAAISAELFPPRVRATGQDVTSNSGRILAAVGAWQMGNIMALFGSSYPRAGAAIVFVYFSGMACIWFAPETKDRPLPE